MSVPVLRLEGLEWKEMEWMMRCELYLSVEGLSEKRGYLEYGTDFKKMSGSEKSVVHESAMCK